MPLPSVTAAFAPCGEGPPSPGSGSGETTTALRWERLEGNAARTRSSGFMLGENIATAELSLPVTSPC